MGLYLITDYNGGFKAKFLAAAHVAIKECRGLSITVSACGRPKMRAGVARIGKEPVFKRNTIQTIYNQWEFQDPKMEVLYHIRLYFLGIFPYIGLT